MNPNLPPAPSKLPSVSATGLAALLTISGLNHFAGPRFYYSVVPRSITTSGGLTSRESWIRISGVLEFAGAAGLLMPQTRKAAATCTALMFSGFTAGHLSALRHAFGPHGSARARKIHLLRLPLQPPLVLWTWSVRRR